MAVTRGRGGDMGTTAVRTAGPDARQRWLLQMNCDSRQDETTAANAREVTQLNQTKAAGAATYCHRPWY